MSLPQKQVIDLAKEAGFSEQYIENFINNVGDFDLLQRQSVNIICKHYEEKLLNESYY